MIALEHVCKRYGNSAVVDDLSFRVAPGELFVLIGPSGCGKSTSLRLMNRLIERSAGRITFDGKDVDSFRPEALRRRMGYAIQSGGLFPHRTVGQNVATVPELLRWPRARIADRVTALLDLLRLPADFAAKYPHELSGGQQQRVGVARALAADPDVLLMDEPFGALDPITRTALQDEIARIHRETRKTIVLVTHDMQEALRLAGRIAVLRGGRLAQLGTPAELLAHPADEFVRDFLGEQDRGLKLLGTMRVADRLRPGTADGPPVGPETSLQRALSLMVERGVDRLPVLDGDRPLGTLHLADLVTRDPAAG